jgi:hypothetical protein
MSVDLVEKVGLPFRWICGNNITILVHALRQVVVGDRDSGDFLEVARTMIASAEEVGGMLRYFPTGSATGSGGPG